MAVMLKARGLYTYKNELSVPEGSLDVADNIIIDEDGVVEPRRGLEDYGDVLPQPEYRAKQIMVYKDLIFRHFDTTIQFDDGTGTFTNFTGTFNELESGLRIKYLEANSNFYFTTDVGIKKLSAKTQSDIVAGAITQAGGAKAAGLTGSINFTPGGWLAPESAVAYRVVWGRKDKNNNLILGSPSSRFVIKNSSADLEIQEAFTITVGGQLVDQDYVLFSSKDTDYFVWFNTATAVEPQTGDTLGRTAIEAKVSTTADTSGDAAVIANAIAKYGDFSVDVTSSTVTVTVINTGDVIDVDSIDISLGTSPAENITTAVAVQGSITTGDSATVTLDFVIPDQVNTTDYFYQVYRTAYTSVVLGLTLDELEPGDEMNIVYESAVTTAELAAKEISVEDITPDSFRAVGAFLYTNPITGQGILQANERPPIAKDIALFRNSVFYANTKTSHKTQFNLVSVDDFTSGVSQFVVVDKDVHRTYTFRGEKEVTDIVCDTFANTTADSVILINSARDEIKYYIHLDKGFGTDPLIVNRTRIHVDLSGTVTADDVATKLASVLDLLGDFSATATTGTVTVTNFKNGNTIDAVKGSPDPGGGWSVTVTTQGDGQDAAINEVLLSSQISVAQAIDETARSLVEVINKDTSSSINAYYLSGSDDLPGQILLEKRTLEDTPFYIAVNESIMTGEFDPSLPLLSPITNITLSAGVGSPARINAAGHAVVLNDKVIVYDTDTTPVTLGEFTATNIAAGYFDIDFDITAGSTTNHGFFFFPDVESDNEESPNRVFFSKIQQPESVPIVNFLDIGPQDKAIERIIALRDNLFVLKEDGVYIITGSSAPNFGTRLLDGSSNIVAPDSAVVLNNQIYALSNDGVVKITESGGVQVISRPIENKILDITNPRHDFKFTSFGVGYDSDRSYLLWMPTIATDTVATQCYRYNTFTNTWTRFILTNTCGLVNPSDDKLYLGSGDREYISQERKNRDRKDYSDRSFANTISSTKFNGDNFIISNTIDVEVGDVITQTQYVTIAKLRMFLAKLDIDSGYTATFEQDFLVEPGDFIDAALTGVAARLNSEDATITATTFSSDFATMQTEFNTLVDELNGVGSNSTFKDYKKRDYTVEYEVIIENVKGNTNTVTVNLEVPFLAGVTSIYKGYIAEFQYSPQHFGDPASLKQIMDGTFIFDQTNFYSATVSYASDNSQDFTSIDFKGLGSGDWGVSTGIGDDDGWGFGTWGGSGDDVPMRTLIPLEKQRCRYLTCAFKHINAREQFKLLGISLEPRQTGKRGYRR